MDLPAFVWSGGRGGTNGIRLSTGRWPPFRGQLAAAHGEFRAVHSGRYGQWTRYLRADSQRQTSDNSVQALQLCQSVAERAEVGGLLEMPTNGAVLGDCTWPECRTIRGALCAALISNVK